MQNNLRKENQRDEKDELALKNPFQTGLHYHNKYKQAVH